ncbi:hypothetical protein WICPIJ_006538 [Wickerhamomyces pijperi]|uniref:C-CAP/cofactor C-like domain-containing protein n=1 Tax=Wickerhamomyces pijperi TaxID=599730 RepID=A0A9P8Q1Z4_WICPI|nr:hypothetical protein WICPIJ_006538 [Wickerhamomyces pijperi]
MLSTSQITKDSISTSLNLIETSIAKKISTEDEVKQAISKLRSDLDRIKHSLAPYELQRFSDKVNDLAKKLESSGNAPTGRKFKFSGRVSGVAKKERPRKISPTYQESTLQPTISNKKNEVLQIVEANPIIQGISKCIIIADSVDSLQLFDIDDSIILINHNRSSNFIKGAKNCILYLVTNSQTRLHDLEDCKIKLLECDKIIIENCSGLKVSKGASVDDFNSPLGNSTNFEFVQFSEEFENLLSEINGRSGHVLSDIERHLELL